MTSSIIQRVFARKVLLLRCSASLYSALWVKMPKSKRQKMFEERSRLARDGRWVQETGEAVAVEDQEVSGLSELLEMSEEALDTDDECKDPIVDLDESMKRDLDHQIDEFCENWVLELDRDDQVSLGLFLAFQLKKVLAVGETRAAELAGMMIGRSDKVGGLIFTMRDKYQKISRVIISVLVLFGKVRS